MKDLLRKLWLVEDTRPLRLFIKNTALCKHESGRIGCNALPGAGRLIDGVSASEALDRSPGKRRP